MSEDDNGRSKRDWAKVISVVIAVLTLFFGNNLYQQWTGRSFLSDIRANQQIATKAITPTPVSKSAVIDTSGLDMGSGANSVVILGRQSEIQEPRRIVLLAPDTGWQASIDQTRAEILAPSVIITKPVGIQLVMQVGWIKNQKQFTRDEIGQVVLGFSNDEQSLPITLSMLHQEADRDYYVIEIPDRYRESTLTRIKVVFTAFPSVAPEAVASSLKEIAVLALR